MLATLEMDFTVVYTEEGTNRFLKVLGRFNMVAVAKVYRRNGHDWNSSGVRVVRLRIRQNAALS